MRAWWAARGMPMIVHPSGTRVGPGRSERCGGRAYSNLTGSGAAGRYFEDVSVTPLEGEMCPTFSCFGGSWLV